MKSNAEEQNAVRHYLLGLLPPAQQQSLEERLLTDASFYEELQIAEDELIDGYLAGELSGREREAFESHFMGAPGRDRQVRFARALIRYVSAHGPEAAEVTAEPSGESAPPARLVRRRGGVLSYLRAGPALALAAVLLLALGLSWAVIRSSRPGGPRQVLAVVLTPGGVTRGGGDAQQVTLPDGTDEVRLRLRLAADESQGYRAALLDARGATVFTAEGLRPEPDEGGEVVALSVPAGDLPSGHYLLRLEGVRAGGPERAGSYYFRAVAPQISH
jgi:hypothetical protein